MKNKKQIFLLILMLLLLFGSLISNVKAETVKQIIKEGNKSKIILKIRELKQKFEQLKGKTTLTDEEKDIKEQIPRDLEDLNDKLDELNSQGSSNTNASGVRGNSDKAANNKPNNVPNTELQGATNDEELNDKTTPSKQKSSNEKNNESSKEDGWSSIISYALYGLIGLMLLGGIIAGGYFLRRNKHQERDHVDTNFNYLKKQQRALGEEVKQLAEVSKKLSEQMAQHRLDIARLKESSRNVSSNVPPPPPVINSYQEPKVEPEFPTTVEDYLVKVKNGAIPVKYDYKEGMIVQDAAQEGGLLVVRNNDGQLYLVPSFGFFQTKSDYTNYFERYYACARPSGGNVWIRKPATVNQVNGGWQLAQQGELEVR